MRYWYSWSNGNFSCLWIQPLKRQLSSFLHKKYFRAGWLLYYGSLLSTEVDNLCDYYLWIYLSARLRNLLLLMTINWKWRPAFFKTPVTYLLSKITRFLTNNWQTTCRKVWSFSLQFYTLIVRFFLFTVHVKNIWIDWLKDFKVLLPFLVGYG